MPIKDEKAKSARNHELREEGWLEAALDRKNERRVVLTPQPD